MADVTSESRLMTAEELIRLPSGTWRYELIRGELRRMSPAGHVHGKMAARVGAWLASFVEQHRLGETYAAETGFLLHRFPDTVRAPDCAFVSHATLAAREPLPDGYFPGAPDLAVEVISPSDTYTEVEEKTAEWIDCGCKVVIVLDPRRKVATLHRPGNPVTTLGPGDRLEIPDLLPGWSVSANELFS